MSDDKAQQKINGSSESQKDLAQQIGERLREARVSKGVDMATIANRLRLQHSYLEALEKGDWQELPETVYVLGFLRQYAEELGLDVSQDIDLLKTGVFVLKPAHTMPAPGIVPSRNWFRIALILFLIAFVAVNVIYFSKKISTQLNFEPLSSTVIDSLPDMVAPLALEEDLDDTADKKVAMNDFSQPELDLADSKVMVNTAVVMETESLALASSMNEVVQPALDPYGSGVEAILNKPLAFTDSAQMPELQTSLHQYHFSAKGQDVWIEVSNASKKKLLSTLIPSGTTRVLQHRSPFLYLTCGNAVALSVHLDGVLIVSAGELGKSGQVVRRHKMILSVASTSL